MQQIGLGDNNLNDKVHVRWLKKLNQGYTYDSHQVPSCLSDLARLNI